MSRGKRKYLTNWMFFIVALLVAIICWEINENRTLLEKTLLGAAQTLIYTGLTLSWSVSVRHRIVQPQIRRLLECISALILFWFLTRGIKYYVLDFFDGVENIRRYLWYLYYIPMIFMPTVMMMTAFSLRKPENYRLPKKAVIALLSTSLVLFLCVLTNDLHQLVFYFPEDAVVFTDSEYGYGFLYYLCLGWNIGCLLIAFVVTLKRCRLPNSKKLLWIPAVPVALWGIYGILYITSNVSFFDDITAADSAFVMATLELCVAVGLIPSNMHYESLFRVSGLSAIITDEVLRPIYTPNAAEIHDKNMMQRAVDNSSLTENGMRLSAYPISGGYAFWQDDMTEVSRLIDMLEDIHIDLEDQQLVLKESLDTRKKSQSLVEKNRLYNLMQTQTEDKVARLYDLAKELDSQTEEAEINRLITEIALISAYLKRRNNLIFIAEENNTLTASELGFCIKESLDNLTQCGVDSNLRFALEGTLSFETVTKLYDAFETAVEAALPTLSLLLAVVAEDCRSIELTLNLNTEAELAVLSDYGFTVTQDGENDWTLSYALVKGGECL